MKKILIVDVTAIQTCRSRDNLLADIVKFLQSHHLPLRNLRGLALIEGEGSFSEARQATAILNTIHLIKGIPVLGVDRRKYGGDEQKMFAAILKHFHRPKQGWIKPIYSGAPRIT